MTEVTATATQPVVNKQDIDKQVDLVNGLTAQLGFSLVEANELTEIYSSSAETANAQSLKAQVAARITKFEVGRASLSLFIAALGIGGLILLKGSHRKVLQGAALLTTLLSTWQAGEATWTLSHIRAKAKQAAAKQSRKERDVHGAEAKKHLQENEQLLATYEEELTKLEQLLNAFNQVPAQ